MNYNKNNTARRPKSEEVSDDFFQSEWDRIFGNKDNKEKEEVKPKEGK